MIKELQSLYLIILSFTNVVQFVISETHLRQIPEELFLQPLASRENASPNWKTHHRPSQSGTLLEPIIIHHKKGKKDQNREQSSSELCQGACLPLKLCEHHSGVPNGNCASGSVCCLFERTCGDITREKLSFFRSPNYPVLQNDSLDCTYELYPAEDTCALKVEFLSFKINRAVHYSKTEKCMTDALYLLNTNYGSNEPLCDMENHTVIVYVKKLSPKPVKFILISQSTDVKWNLKVTQVNCRKLQIWQNEPKCGRQLIYESESKHENGDTDDDSSSNEFVQETPNFVLNPLIVNGKDAENREFPWQISLQIKGKGYHRCGGSILNQQFILTAAHCVMRNAYESKHKLKVIVGDYNLNETNEVKHQEFEIESIIGHFHYKPQNSHINDIAVLKIVGTINYSSNIQPVCLPPTNYSADGKVGWVSGWGRLNGSDSMAFASTLQKLQVSIIDDETCRSLVLQEVQTILKRNVSAAEIDAVAKLGRSRTQLCAQAKLNSAVCFGDSGGPLIVQNVDDGSFIQVGVVSYGLGRCVTERNPPAAYTKITEFLDFIAIATSTYF